ncbi:MAG: hypothetical protein ACYCVE_05765, partial [Gemmatimonadaceae bacterium]
LTLRLDPRIKTSPAALAQLAALSREMYDGAVAAHAAYSRARALVAALDGQQGAGVDAFKAQLEALAPAPVRGGRGRGFGGFGRGRGPAGPPTLEGVSTAMLGAAMAMQGADVAPTANDVAACSRARSESRVVTAKWKALRTAGLAALNAKRKAAGQPPITLPDK